VLRTTEITPIFWGPEGSFASSYEREIDQFYTDLAADSGRAGNFFSVLAQYFDTLDGPRSYVNYHVTAGAPLDDRNPYPTGAGEICADPFEPGVRPCISDTGLRNELSSFIEAHRLPVGIGHEYIVNFPRGVDSCFGEGGEEDPCSGTYYCAYHSAMAVAGGEVEYANEPENADPAYGPRGVYGCDPQNVAEGQATINTTSHEISESVTDPEPRSGWYDENLNSQGQEWAEIGDICAWTFAQEATPGIDVIPDGGSNQSIHGDNYLLQTEWDNADNTCSVSAAAAGVTSPAPSFGVSPASSAPTGTALAFDGSSSNAYRGYTIVGYSWDFGDGATATGTHPTHVYASTGEATSREYTVTLTVLDSIGQRASATRAVTVTDRLPTALFTPPAGVVAGSAATFVGSSSSDPDGHVTGYDWNWGDGSANGSGPTAAHAFPKAGLYTVTLTVTDNSGGESSISHAVEVGAAPEPPTGPPPNLQLVPVPNTQISTVPQAGQGVLASKSTGGRSRTSHRKTRRHRRHRRTRRVRRGRSRPIGRGHRLTGG
jgi:PKD repeat protein